MKKIQYVNRFFAKLLPKFKTNTRSVVDGKHSKFEGEKF